MKIRKFREAAGLTMRELAGKVGVSIATVSRWESGEDFPAAGRLPLLASALGCTIDELFGRSPPDQAERDSA